MPEGDTIHRAAARLREAFAGRRLTKAEVRRRSRHLVPDGAAVSGVEARGKHILVRLDCGLSIHVHLGLVGACHVYRSGERWRKPAHAARLVLATEGAEAVCFDAPVVEVLDTAELEQHAALNALGPDLCGPGPDIDEALARLATLDPRKAIGEVLLDQRIAAGIGNVYRNEVLFARRVHPRTPLGSLDAGARRALFETASRMLRANLRPGRRATVDRGLAVYGRAGKACVRCRTAIRSAPDGDDRTVYWCPRCQREPV